MKNWMLGFSLVFNMFFMMVSSTEVMLPAYDIANYHYNQMMWVYMRGCLHGTSRTKRAMGWSRQSPGFICERGRRDFEEFFNRSYDRIYDKAWRVYE